MNTQEIQLSAAFKSSWSRETSSDPDRWSRYNPAQGQCAVTACVAQDILGGEIVWAEVLLPDGQKISHYFNQVAGQELDFTRNQFPTMAQIPPGQPKTKDFETTRDYVLSFPATRDRYEKLKTRVTQWLARAE